MYKTFLMLLAAVALPWPGLAVEGDFQWSGRLAQGQAIEIKGVNGGIRAQFAPGQDVQVTARKSGNRSDPSTVQVVAVPNGGGMTICAVYPGDGGRPNECKPGNEGRMSTHDNDVKVEFTVHVPRGVRLIAKTVNGEVDAANLQSDIEAHSVNGKIQVSTSGLVSAKTVNGGIEASMGASTWDHPLEFSAVNGGISLTLPSAVNANVQASTVNGGMTTDFPLTVSGSWGPKKLNGRLGNGGPELKLSTVNGGIQLHSGSGRKI